MRNKILSLLVAGLLLVSVNSFATIVNSTARSITGAGELYTAYITASASDTTATVNGPVIDNRDGSIQSVSVMVNTTAAGGTSPTINAVLRGSNNGTNFFGVLSGDATPVAVQSGATAITSSTTFGYDSTQELRGIGGFPGLLQVQLLLAGTSPTWNGTVTVFIVRKK